MSKQLDRRTFLAGGAAVVVGHGHHESRRDHDGRKKTIRFWVHGWHFTMLNVTEDTACSSLPVHCSCRPWASG